MKKTNKYFIYSTIIGLFIALFFSCQSDIGNTVATITGKVDNDMLNAQAWYNSTRQNAPVLLGFAKVKSTKSNMEAKPDWKHTYTLREKDYSAVHVQLSMKGTFSFVTPENKQAYEATKDERYVKTFTRMVVLTDKKDKSTVGFLMTLVPDKAYIESTHFAALKSNYKQWQKGYSGYVFYHTLDGKFNNAWRFANGKVIKEVTQVVGTDLDLNMRARKKVATDVTCVYTTYEVWSQNCTDWTVNGEYDHTSCGEWYSDGTTTDIECHGNDDTGGGSIGSGGYTGPGGPGGGGYVSYDCAGVANGSAYFDDCEECIGGTTGIEICPMCGEPEIIDSEILGVSSIKKANSICTRCKCAKTPDLIYKGKNYKERTKIYLNLTGSIGLQGQASVSLFFPVKVCAAAFKIEQVTSYFTTYDDINGWNFGITVNSKDYYYDFSGDVWVAGIRTNKGQSIDNGYLYDKVKEVRQGLLTQTQTLINGNWVEDPTKEVFKLEVGASFVIIVGGGFGVGIEGTYFEMK